MAAVLARNWNKYLLQRGLNTDPLNPNPGLRLALYLADVTPDPDFFLEDFGPLQGRIPGVSWELRTDFWTYGLVPESTGVAEYGPFGFELEFGAAETVTAYGLVVLAESALYPWAWAERFGEARVFTPPTSAIITLRYTLNRCD